MLKNRFHLIPATLVSILFSSCSFPRDGGGNSSVPFQNSSLRQTESVETPPESASNGTPTPREPAVWDTDEVDISEIDEGRKLISFTFDDAPNKSLENILAVFASFNENNPDCKASATVFFNGGLFDAQTPHLLHAACALGFELGNHTQSHADLTTLTEEEIDGEILRTDQLLSRIDGKKAHLLRAPFGRIDERVRKISTTPIIDWTIDTLDWQGRSAQEIYDSVFAERFSGAIVLMHDGYPNTVAALKRLLPDLKADGYQVVSVSKMSKAHGCTLRRGNAYIRLRKQK